MNYQQKLSVNVEKQESGYGLRLQLNSMPLDFIVQIIRKTEILLEAEGIEQNPLKQMQETHDEWWRYKLDPAPQSVKDAIRKKLMQSTQLLPQGKIINGEFYGDAYCVKCKDKRNFIGRVITSDSGRRMAQGKCGICGTKLNRILGKDL